MATDACNALRRLFPPEVRTPLMRQVLRAHLPHRVSLTREVALDDLLQLEPQGAREPRDLLDTLVATGMLREREVAYGEGHGFAESAESKANELLKRLLATPIPAQALFQGLAAARCPTLRPFVPWLREHLGDAPLEPETLAALLKGLASPDPLVCANAFFVEVRLHAEDIRRQMQGKLMQALLVLAFEPER